MSRQSTLVMLDLINVRPNEKLVSHFEVMHGRLLIASTMKTIEVQHLNWFPLDADLVQQNLVRTSNIACCLPSAHMFVKIS